MCMRVYVCVYLCVCVCVYVCVYVYVCVFMYVCVCLIAFYPVLLIMFQEQFVEKMKTHVIFNKLFSQIVPFIRYVEKYY
jgi:hypothetical protein